MSRLVVGPRSLSPTGEVEVWIDTGSGPGFTTPVPVSQLTLAPIDNGEGDDAIYRLRANDHDPVGSDD